MGENTSQIEREIRERREDLGRNLEELGDKAREMVDWRKHYRDHSPLFLGAALGVGLLVGLKTIPRSRVRYNGGAVEFDTSHDPWPTRPAAAVSNRHSAFSRAGQQLSTTFDQIADGLLQTASDKALELVGGLVPGFSEHVNRRNRA